MATSTTMLGLEKAGLRGVEEVHHNLSTPELVEHAIRRDEGLLVRSGALRATTGDRTGRSPARRRARSLMPG